MIAGGGTVQSPGRPPKETSAERLQSLVNVPGAAATVANLVGNPGTLHMQVARRIRKSLPEAIVAASRHPDSARALLLALALDRNSEARERQKQFIARQLGVQDRCDRRAAKLH